MRSETVTLSTNIIQEPLETHDESSVPLLPANLVLCKIKPPDHRYRTDGELPRSLKISVGDRTVRASQIF